MKPRRIAACACIVLSLSTSVLISRRSTVPVTIHEYRLLAQDAPPTPSPTIAPPAPVPSSTPRKSLRPSVAPAVPGPAIPVGDAQKVAASMLAERGWAMHWDALNNLIRRESGWNPGAVNRRSGACGLFQRLPCRGMNSQPVAVQVADGFAYISGRYGTPSGAWAAFQRKGWY